MSSFLDDVWNKAVGGLDWLKEVIVGEFDDNRPTSAIVADMLVSFVPGVIIVTSARDLTAVVIRLVKHPEKRNEVTEWMLVIGCTIPLVLPILAAAAGAAAAGVGAVIGGIGGSEAGAALRATCLLLIEHGGEMLETLIKFLRRFVKDDVLAVLRDINFTKYSEPITKYFVKFIDGLLAITRKVATELSRYTWFDSVQSLLKKLQELEHGFYEVQHAALRNIPHALTELQARLTKALAEESKPLEHTAVPTIHAPKPKAIPPKPVRSPAMPSNPLGHSPELKPADPIPPATASETNLHPQTKGDPPEVADDADAAKAAAKKKAIQATKDKYGLRQDLDDKYFNDDGTVKWPPNDGAADDWTTRSLNPGDTIDRYGPNSGRFTSPVDDGVSPSFDSRSLAADPDTTELHTFEVVKPFDVQSSHAAPYFDQPGGAEQLNMGQSVQSLVDGGYLKEVKH